MVSGRPKRAKHSRSFSIVAALVIEFIGNTSTHLLKLSSTMKYILLASGPRKSMCVPVFVIIRSLISAMVMETIGVDLVSIECIVGICLRWLQYISKKVVTKRC